MIAFNTLLLVLTFIFGIVWIRSLANWDGQKCNEDKCDECPFPCDKHKN